MNEDLRALIDTGDWFATIAMPSPSRSEDAAHRFAIEWSNARRSLSERWLAGPVEQLDAVMRDVVHGGGEAVVIVAAIGGVTLVETLEEPIRHPLVAEGPLPRLATIIEARQRTIPHVVVEADRAGASITAFDGGTVIERDQVEGDTEHIHRGQFGGWSQRRFQQRAENTWERNAHDVAEVVAEMVKRVDAQLVAVAGDVRAQSLVIDDLPAGIAPRVVALGAGDDAGIAAEVVRELSTIVAAEATELSRSLRAGCANGLATTDAGAVMRALEEGRVEVLAVHDDGSDGPITDDGARLVDAAIAGALRTDARIVVIPGVAVLDGPVGARLRW